MKFGLCCICETLKKEGHGFKTMTRKSFLSKPREESIRILGERILHNIKLTQKIIIWCSRNSIWHYRISSSLFPLLTDPTLNLSFGGLPNWKEIETAMKFVGNVSETYGVSVSCHPDQFNVLASYNPDVVAKTILELNFQAWVLDTMGFPQSIDCPMCLHVALSPKDEEPEDFAFRFLQNFAKCRDGVRRRLVLENEDSGFWSAANLIKYFDHFPFVFDNLHDACNPSGLLPQEIIEAFAETWGDHTPVFHFSEGRSDKMRSHTDFFSFIPDYITNNSNIIWECEVKSKDLAILKLIKELEKEG